MQPSDQRLFHIADSNIPKKVKAQSEKPRKALLNAASLPKDVVEKAINGKTGKALGGAIGKSIGPAVNHEFERVKSHLDKPPPNVPYGTPGSPGSQGNTD